MALAIGTALRHYEIRSLLGSGGMGEVYRARDTRLARDVAIKVLPEAVARNAKWIERFEREARVLAALNHPHIAAIYGREEVEETHALVLELVEGPTLADRLAGGPLPVEEALEIARQIAQGVEAAHEKGIVHRDLKPANIKVTEDGTVKVLDFGLAKALGDEAPVSADLNSPTLSELATAVGVLLGTAAYMSPEQARGQKAGRRADVWAFGCVLFEMLAGYRPFDGETVTDVLAAIVKEQPDWSRLPADTPPTIRRLLRRCLEKDLRERLHDIGDARIEIGDVIREPVSQGPAIVPAIPPGTSPPKRVFTALSGLAAGILIGTLLTLWTAGGKQRMTRQPATPTAGPVGRGVVELPPEAPLAVGARVPLIGYDSPVIALSPDGTQLAYVGESGRGTQLYLRAMDGFEVKLVPGTESAVHPFFSPDGRWLGFLTDDKVKKVSLQGGGPVTICEARAAIRATWTRDDAIYFAQNEGRTLMRVAAGGARPVEIKDIREMRNVRTIFNQVLPDGKSALLTSWSRGISADYADILLLSLETLETRRLIEFGYDARYVSTGHLLFGRAGNLLVAPFDLERLEARGDPVPAISGVAMASIAGQAQVAIADDGSLVYVPGGDNSVGELAQVDRRGKTEVLPVPERVYGSFDLAPGGRRLAVHVADVNDYVWIYDIDRREGRKLTATGDDGWPAWMPDGRAVTLTSRSPGEGWRILRQDVDGHGRPEVLVRNESQAASGSWSADGRVLVYDVWTGARSGINIFSMPDKRDFLWLPREGNVRAQQAQLSPDGRWVAYLSNATGQYQTWVRSFPDGETVRQISVDGGVEPRWCEKCDQLFYRNGGRWMASRFSVRTEPAWEPPQLAFETDFIDTPGLSYDVSADGQLLFVVKRAREPIRTKLHVIHNWFKELERLSPRTE